MIHWLIELLQDNCQLYRKYIGGRWARWNRFWEPVGYDDMIFYNRKEQDRSSTTLWDFINEEDRETYRVKREK